MKGEYDDIIERQHHVSAVHKPMSMDARAAQFAPFAALDGHEEAVYETGRYVEQRIEASPDDQVYLSEKIARALSLGENGTVRITYYVPDTIKQGGFYRDCTGMINSVDTLDGALCMADGTVIKFRDILDIDITTDLL